MFTFLNDTPVNLGLLKALSDFQTKFNIDYLNIGVIDANKKIYEAYKFCKTGDFQLSYLQENNVIHVAYNNLKPVYHVVESDDPIVPINKSFVEEICIPIKVESPKDVIVYVYFGFANKTEEVSNILSSFFTTFNLFEVYSYALLKYCQLTDIERISKLLMVLEDSVKFNQPSIRLHGFNVAFWTIEIAKKLNFPQDEFEKLHYAALLHDIGKIRVRSSIVNKKGPLTEDEYKEIKKHAEYGYIITKELFGDVYPDIPLWVKHHHEMYDGSGYPSGLKGNDIPFPSRIIKVADVIDVLYSPRSYKQNVSVDKIIAELKRCSRKDFDPEVVEAALQVIDERIVLPMDILKATGEKILPANLSLRTYEDVFNFDGYFYFKEDQSYFKSTNAVKDTKDLWNLLSASLVVEVLNSIYEYEVDVFPVDENTYLVSNIRLLERKRFVSILWDLEAHLITQDEKSITVKVKRLSGDYVLFVCENAYAFDAKNYYKLVLQFEDGEILILNGRITYSYPASHEYSYYRYTFANIGETTRDKLFRQIFKKQVALRRQLKQVQDKK
ncbi:metal dependent phosphohydrolase [Caldicellulosiruptor saccharolyticus DSM 8903]|uniref:Metal dependent phosphohydrolase n=1 Tax=Caldicellulosiruptor saccharolyticus (strain ATCC 43494 / DSM 8903 / Tp8T 6331) TaxID=351627 RepID=A4XGI3_CALS8|nr:HD-GYP domain-containing protein [Caldicellulosiruptor saccharolyticus]ABP66018.1 metal dependent phosphohydrolase [Caldicellulosiruptor saccharolyticus DSM 8903]